LALLQQLAKKPKKRLSSGFSISRDQIHNFSCGNGYANVVFVIGRALKDISTTRSEQSLVILTALTHVSVPQIKLFSFTNFNCNLIEKQSTSGHYCIKEQSCEGHSADDWEDELGCERCSKIYASKTFA
jgi:hypothetical protein